MSMKSEAADHLKSYLERVERLAEERKALGDDMRVVFAEAKADGFDPKAIRAMAKRRQKDPGELAEEETILDTYMAAIGMIPENPLFAAVSAMSSDAMARDQVIDAFKLLVPINGEIIAKVGGAPMRLWRDEKGVAHAEEYAEPKAPAAKTGKALKTPATVLTMVPRDSVKSAADAAEQRAARKKPTDETTPASGDVETDETVE